MQKLATGILTAVLSCGPGVLFAQQQSPQGTNPSSPNNQDVPHQVPGTDNPDLGQQRQGSTSTSTQPAHSKRKTRHRKTNTASGRDPNTKG